MARVTGLLLSKFRSSFQTFTNSAICTSTGMGMETETETHALPGRIRKAAISAWIRDLIATGCPSTRVGHLHHERPPVLADRLLQQFRPYRRGEGGRLNVGNGRSHPDNAA